MAFCFSSSASTHTARSIVGETAQTAHSSFGGLAPKSPASFNVRLPPSEYPATANACQAVHLNQLAHHRNRIAGEPRVIEAVGQVFGRAAVALVEAHRVEAGGECLVGQAAHVMRLARALEAVKRDERGMLPRPRLPVAVGEHARAGSDVEQARLSGRQRGKRARFSPRVQGHPVAPLPAGRGVNGRSSIGDRPSSIVICPAATSTRGTARCDTRPEDRRRVRPRGSRDRSARRARAAGRA